MTDPPVNPAQSAPRDPLRNGPAPSSPPSSSDAPPSTSASPPISSPKPNATAGSPNDFATAVLRDVTLTLRSIEELGAKLRIVQIELAVIAGLCLLMLALDTRERLGVGAG
jgi:hypothetical protein